MAVRVTCLVNGQAEATPRHPDQPIPCPLSSHYEVSFWTQRTGNPVWCLPHGIVHKRRVCLKRWHLTNSHKDRESRMQDHSPHLRLPSVSHPIVLRTLCSKQHGIGSDWQGGCLYVREVLTNRSNTPAGTAMMENPGVEMAL